jgi:hypothetical protein
MSRRGLGDVIDAENRSTPYLPRASRIWPRLRSLSGRARSDAASRRPKHRACGFNGEHRRVLVYSCGSTTTVPTLPPASTALCAPAVSYSGKRAPTERMRPGEPVQAAMSDWARRRVDLGQRQAVSLDVELPRDRQERLAAKEILRKRWPTRPSMRL